MGKHTAAHTRKKTQPSPDTCRTQKKRKVPLLLVVILGLFLLISAGAAWFVWNTSAIHGSMFTEASTLPTPIPSPTPTAAPDLKGDEPVLQADWIDDEGNAWNYREDLVAVLLIGVDYMSDETYWDEDMVFNGGNSDVLALAVLDTTNNTLSLLHIPRDTMAELLVLDPEGNYLDMTYTNISSAHSFGDGEKLSCDLTVDAVSRLLFGVPIQRYGAVSYDVLQDLSDLIGGVTLTLEKDYTDIDPSFTAGSTVTLTGEQLRKFIIHRDANELDSAYDRGQRHMVLLNVLFDECKKAFQEDITFPIQMYNRAADYITTNLSVSEISYLAQQVFQADFHTDSVTTLQGEMTMGEEYAEYIPDLEWLHDYVAETFCVPAE